VAAHNATMASQLARALLTQADQVDPPVTNENKIRSYEKDPLGFARDILGVTLWSRQKEIVESPLSSKRIAVRSGHKIGKSTALCCIAWWFYCSFPSARVVLTANTADQVDGILWRELKRLARAAALRGFAMPGLDRMADRAKTGIVDPYDLSEIKGCTSREAEAVAGRSGAYMLYLLDEASGIPSKVFKAIEGNRMGGAWLVMTSNPTRVEGEFYEAFHDKKEFYRTISIDSRENPNFTGELPHIPGCAEPEMVAEKLREEGENSEEFQIRICGNFASAESRKIFSLAALASSYVRWHEMDDPMDRLSIGLDPAGDSGEGDESAWAIRRGLKVLAIRTMRGLSPEAHVAHYAELVAEFRMPHELPPVLAVDSEGPVGAKVWNQFTAYAYDNPASVELVRVRSSEKAVRQPLIYGLLRDELFANAKAWLKEGGALPEDHKLERELHCGEFIVDARSRYHVTATRDMRKILKRCIAYGTRPQSATRVPNHHDRQQKICTKRPAAQLSTPILA
jgi:phage terminase large subunit